VSSDDRRRCVGAIIWNAEGHIFVQRRALAVDVYPGAWDIVGGHVLPGESDMEALAREVHEETGWTLRRVCEQVGDWEWAHEGVVRHERDYVVVVDGDLGAPRLYESEHDEWAWVGADAIDILIESTTGDRRLRDIVARAFDAGPQTPPARHQRGA
jgi:8-oxo-dGTP pyrophosphatase MutT (NUDIX family)